MASTTRAKAEQNASPRVQSPEVETTTPPTPPKSGGHRDRVKRARNGSKRKRDLAALAAEQGTQHAIPADAVPSEPAERTWAAVLTQLRRDLPASAFLFLDHCELVGQHRQALVIAGPAKFTDWVRRRYARHIRKVIRERTDFDGLEVCDR